MFHQRHLRGSQRLEALIISLLTKPCFTSCPLWKGAAFIWPTTKQGVEWFQPSNLKNCSIFLHLKSFSMSSDIWLEWQCSIKRCNTRHEYLSTGCFVELGHFGQWPLRNAVQEVHRSLYLSFSIVQNLSSKNDYRLSLILDRAKIYIWAKECNKKYSQLFDCKLYVDQWGALTFTS